ncbi:MAG: Tetratricopeptide repeat protein [candidate division BRC1 bacterium ADurb.BinA364]|nr:MAG: Tetratricopeptide repeat protein [candidate division BRC1 bacterium ADurb.BinA364]
MALQRARIERFLGDLDANRHTMEHAEALLKRLDRPSSSQAAWLAMETGLRAQHLGQYEKALVRFRQARDEWRAAGQPRGEAQALNAQCMCLIYLGDYDGTIRAAREGLRLAGADARWRTEQANLLNNLALALWRKGSLAEAHEAIQSAAVCQRKAGDSLGLAATIMNRGILEEERRHDKRAESSYLNAIRLAERYGFRQVVCCAEANLGNLALKRGRFDLALRHSQKSLEIAEAIQDARSQAIALENIGLACAGLREYADAAKAYERAGAIARRSGDTERAASVGLCRAELDLARGRIALAEKRLAALSQTSQQPPTPDCAIRLKQLEAQTLATRRRTAEAIEAARQSVRLAESAGLADHARRGAELLSSLL